MRTKLLISIFLVAVLALVVSCANCKAIPPVKIYTPPASEADGLWNEAKSMMDEGNWRGARLNLFKALDANTVLGEDSAFLADFKKAAEKTGTCEFCRGGDYK